MWALQNFCGSHKWDYLMQVPKTKNPCCYHCGMLSIKKFACYLSLLKIAPHWFFCFVVFFYFLLNFCCVFHGNLHVWRKEPMLATGSTLIFTNWPKTKDTHVLQYLFSSIFTFPLVCTLHNPISMGGNQCGSN